EQGALRSDWSPPALPCACSAQSAMDCSASTLASRGFLSRRKRLVSREAVDLPEVRERFTLRRAGGGNWLEQRPWPKDEFRAGWCTSRLKPVVRLRAVDRSGRSR